MTPGSDQQAAVASDASIRVRRPHHVVQIALERVSTFPSSEPAAAIHQFVPHGSRDRALMSVILEALDDVWVRRFRHRRGHDARIEQMPTYFHRIARVVCGAGCLPRKELFEAWEVARRVRRRFRGGRVVDLCAGHGLLGQIMLLLDDSSPDVLIVDQALPPSSARLARVMATEWPRLGGRVTFREAPLANVDLREDDVVMSIHACGELTDRVIERGVAARARLAVMPCCHDLDTADTGALTGWLNGPLAVDVVRATTLRARGWQVWTQTIPVEITPHNRLLMAAP